MIAAPAAVCPRRGRWRFDGGRSRDADGAIERFAWSFGDGAERRRAGGRRTPTQRPAATRWRCWPTTVAASTTAASRRSSTLHVNRPPRADGRARPRGLPWRGRGLRRRRVERLGRRADRATAGISATAPRRTARRSPTTSRSPACTRSGSAVTDDSGARCATATDIARVRVNAPPVAAAGGDREGFVGGAHDQLLFDASASTDADGQPLSYLWDLGDGVTRTGEKVLHAYAEPGEYAVRLGVADGTGLRLRPDLGRDQGRRAQRAASKPARRSRAVRQAACGSTFARSSCCSRSRSRSCRSWSPAAP